MSEADLYVGLMSGTSADGLDAALVRFAGDEPQLQGHLTLDFPEEMRRAMAALRAPGEDEIARLGWLDGELGAFCADAVQQLLLQTKAVTEQVAAVGWAGHTIRHAPDARPPFSLQAGDAAVICWRTGLPVVCEFRRSDIAAGGQGAPLAPLFHRAFFSGEEDRAVVNLGGIANVSILPGRARKDGQLRGFDTGPANCLMDEWTQRHLHQPKDDGGRWAASGTVSQPLLKVMMDTPWLERPPPKSTGRELFNLAWLDELLPHLPQQPEAQDVQATLALFTARTVAGHLARHCPQIRTLILSGGGVGNEFLLQCIGEQASAAGLDADICSAESFGVHPSLVESVGIAWLARCRLREQPLDMAPVTGGQRTLLGAVLRPPGD